MCTGVVYVLYVLLSMPTDISIYEFQRAWCESMNSSYSFVVVPAKNVARALIRRIYRRC